MRKFDIYRQTKLRAKRRYYPLYEQRGYDIINDSEQINDIREETKDVLRSIDTGRGEDWWDKPKTLYSGQVVCPVMSIEKDIYNYYFRTNMLSDNNYFEPGIARIAVGELEFDLSRKYSNEFQMLKKILNIIMTIEDEYCKYDSDLNGISYDELYEHYGDIIETEYLKMKKRIFDNEYTRNNMYSIIRIDSFEQSKLFCKYTSDVSPWCTTYSKSKYDAYEDYGNNTIYHVVYKSFKDIEKPEIDDELGGGRKASWIDYYSINDDGMAYLPYDEYGLSLMHIVVTPEGRLNNSTGRWNHELGVFARDYLDEEQLSNVLGVNFYKAFRPR